MATSGTPVSLSGLVARARCRCSTVGTGRLGTTRFRARSGGQAELPDEGAGEGRLAAVTGLQGNIDDRHVAAAEQRHRKAEPRPPDVVADGLAHCTPETPMKLERAEPDRLCQIVQPPGRHQILLDEIEHAPHRGIGLGVGGGWRRQSISRIHQNLLVENCILHRPGINLTGVGPMARTAFGSGSSLGPSRPSASRPAGRSRAPSVGVKGYRIPQCAELDRPPPAFREIRDGNRGAFVASRLARAQEISNDGGMNQPSCTRPRFREQKALPRRPAQVWRSPGREPRAGMR
nr:hypothetical protein [Chelatococcus sp. SYSU_G07232]